MTSMASRASLELQTLIREEAPIMFLPREHVHTHSMRGEGKRRWGGEGGGEERGREISLWLNRL